jgi:hypothetical protein
MDQYGGEKKPKKTKKTIKNSTKPNTKKPAAKKTTKTTKTRSKAKGGNFLGSVGDLVAPTGWGPFATAAGLLAVDRVSAALRKGTKEKKEKMKGGDGCRSKPSDAIDTTLIGKEYTFPSDKNRKTKKIGLSNWVQPPFSTVVNEKNNKSYESMKKTYNKWINDSSKSMITIKCFDEKYYYFQVTITCNGKTLTYHHKPENYNQNNNSKKYKGYLFETFEEAKEMSENKDIQFALINSALNYHHNFCKS